MEQHGIVYLVMRAMTHEQHASIWKYTMFELSKMSHLSAMQWGEMMTIGDIKKLLSWNMMVLYAQK